MKVPVFFTRRAAAKYVREFYGLRCSEKWLAKLVVTGGGPRYFKDGRAVIYRFDMLDAWAARRVKGPFGSSSDPDARIRSTRLWETKDGLPFVDLDTIELS